MSAPPPVSIGLPVYNGEDYLEDALECLLGQTFGDFELIVCDNASTDGSEEIARRFAARDPRIVYHRNPENIGAAGNYNLAFELSRGRWFKWTAHDDRYAPEYLERVHAAIAAAPEDVVLCYPRTVLIDTEGQELGLHPDRMHLDEPTPHARLLHFVRSWGMCNPIFGLMPREVLARTGRIRPYISSDVVLLAELAMAGRFLEVPEPLFYRRIHDRSSRQGELSLAEVAAWFDPRAKGPGWLSPRTQTFLRILRLTGQVPLPWTERLRCAAVHVWGWWTRRARASLGQLRRRVSARA